MMNSLSDQTLGILPMALSMVNSRYHMARMGTTQKCTAHIVTMSENKILRPYTLLSLS